MPFDKGSFLKNAYWATKGNSLMYLCHVMVQVKKEIKAYPEVSTEIQTSQSQGQASVTPGIISKQEA